MSEVPSLLTAADVAKIMQVSAQTVYRWAKPENGEPPRLPSVVVGGIVRFRPADLEALIAAEPKAVNE